MRRPHLRPRRAGALALVPLAAALAACAGVPTSSNPQVIGPAVGAPASAGPSFRPEPGTDPRTLVKGFLAANDSDDPNHAAARLFLTTDARSRWSDTTATVLDNLRVSTFAANSTVTVSGAVVGTIDAQGVYTPVLAGEGGGSKTVQFSFLIKGGGRGGEWRIDQLKDGLLLSLGRSDLPGTFAADYHQRPVYFVDADRHLVPDPRYSVLKDSQDPTTQEPLVNWLATVLANGPSPQLANSVTSALPAGVNPSVTFDSVWNVTIPGAAQLDSGTRFLLAAQIAATFAPVTGSEPIQLLDSGHPLTITINHANVTQFSSSDFANSLIPSSATPPALYYVRGGGVEDASGAPLPGALGSGGYGLSSVALSPLGSNDLRVAGIAGKGDSERLLIGTRSQGLHLVSGVTGRLTRPSWDAITHEVWVGDGTTIYRVTAGGVATAVTLTPSATAQPPPVLAVRISPDGSRIAAVLGGASGTAQLWIGTIVRAAEQVRIDSLTPITPIGIALTDVAWVDPLKLFVIGKSNTSGQPNVFEVQVDGSLWIARTLTNLPSTPDSITVAENANAWVAAGGAVWTQLGQSWVSPGSADGSQGSSPVYVE